MPRFLINLSTKEHGKLIGPFLEINFASNRPKSRGRAGVAGPREESDHSAVLCKKNGETDLCVSLSHGASTHPGSLERESGMAKPVVTEP